MMEFHRGAVHVSMWLVLLLIIPYDGPQVNGENILMVPFDHGSHVNLFCVLGNALQEAGHTVHVLVSTKFEKLARANKNLNAIVPPVWKRKNLINNIIPEKLDSFKILEVFAAGFNLSKTQATELLLDGPSLGSIRQLNLDLMIMDGFDLARNMYVLPYKLSVPFMTLTPRSDPWSARIPALPSTEGFIPFTILHSESTVFHRFGNALAYLFNVLLTPPSPFSPTSDSLIEELVPEKENVGFSNLYLQSEMILLNIDAICLDFPRISAPYYQFIGGIGAKPANPLPPDLNKMFEDSSSGVILLTFGSALKTLPDDMLRALLEVSKDLKHTFIIRHVGGTGNLKVPDNVHIYDWLPQNDILGHPKTKLFITHGGNNGQLEAVYHGVPMLVIPVFGDQFYNARRVEFKGYGRSLLQGNISADELRLVMNDLLENEAYFNSVKKCSRILRKLPDPREKAVFWVDYVLQFGGSQLKPHYLHMPLWQFFMLDVLLLVLVAGFILKYLVKFCCRKVCCRHRHKHEKVE